MATASRPVPWLNQFFRRVKADDENEAVPVLDVVETRSDKVAAEIHAVLDAVAEVPAPAFAGWGKWEAVRGEMAGFYKVRVQEGGANYRLVCLL